MPILYDVGIEDYHSDPHYCSHSRFRDFVKYGPRFYFETHVTRTRAKKGSKAMREGSLFETYWCDEEAFEQAVFIQRVDGRTIKPQLDAARAAGKEILKLDDYERLAVMRASLLDNADAMALIEPANLQATIRGSAYGLPFQSRPDYLNLEGCALSDYCPYTNDLKTCESLNDYRGKAPKLYYYGYHTQAAAARALLRACGVPSTRHFLTLVEKGGSCRTKVVEIPPAVLDFADAFYAKYAPELAHCYASNTWPRTEPTETIELPDWATDTTPATTDEEETER